MSHSLEIMESEWLSRLSEMRAAISGLKLSNRDVKTGEYGHDLDLSDDDFSPGTGSEDLWDLISEYSDDEDESEVSAGPSATIPPPNSVKSYDRDWLIAKCAAVSQRASGLDAQTLQDNLLAILASDSSGKQHV